MPVVIEMHLCVLQNCVFFKIVETVEFEMVVQGKRVCFGSSQQPCSFYVKSHWGGDRTVNENR